MKLILTALLCFISMSFSAHAQEPVRIDDVRLHHPFKSGVLKGVTLGIYTFEIRKQHLVTPDDAQLPEGFESYVRHHGAFAYYAGVLIGGAWALFVVGFLLLGVVLRLRTNQFLQVRREA